jgi:hypothetical protein
MSAFMLALVSPAVALDNKFERATLAGLMGVHVVVEDMDPATEKDGLERSTLQTDVELKLRQAGIRVLTREEVFAVPGTAALYLNVNTLRHRTGLYAYCIELELKQGVTLIRNLAITTLGATWQAPGFLGTVGADRLHTVRDDVRDQVDQFLNAYLAANPKK